MANVMTLNDL